MRRRVKAIFVGSIGNLVEWYDFYAYAAFALFFAGAFFPAHDPVVQQLNAAILFALGFVVRPLGGWLFGHFADHYGRRGALMLSVLLMCFGSLMIAVLPTYASIGVAAPALLAIARLIQGLSLGGRSPSSPGHPAPELPTRFLLRGSEFYSVRPSLLAIHSVTMMITTPSSPISTKSARVPPITATVVATATRSLMRPNPCRRRHRQRAGGPGTPRRTAV